MTLPRIYGPVADRAPPVGKHSIIVMFAFLLADVHEPLRSCQ